MPIFFRRGDPRAQVAVTVVHWLQQLADRGQTLADFEAKLGVPELTSALQIPPGTPPPETVEAVVRGVLTWIRTARAAGHEWHGMSGLSDLPPWTGALKAALLHRIIGDPEVGVAPKDPLPEPPPTSYSYPWYRLLDEGSDRAVGIERWRLDWMPDLNGLEVNGSGFTILDEPNPETWIVRHMHRVPEGFPGADEYGWILSSAVFEVTRDPPSQGSGPSGPGSEQDGLLATHSPIEHEGGNKIVYVPSGITGMIRVLTPGGG